MRPFSLLAVGLFCVGCSGAFAKDDAGLRLEAERLSSEIGSLRVPEAARSCGAGASVASQEPPACSRLSALTCAPGRFPDGTGVARSASKLEDEVEPLRKQAAERFRAEFRKLVDSPEEAYFRNLAFGALGLGVDPGCQKNPVEARCLENLVEGLTELAVDRSLPRAGVPGLGGAFGGGFELNALGGVLQNAAFTEIERRVGDELNRRIFAASDLAKIGREVFPRVRELILSRIRDQVPDPEKRRRLLDKIRGIRFVEDGRCNFGSSGGAANVSALLVPNAFYNPQSNTFTYCNGLLLRSNSEFQIAAIVAHEISHAIDPCYAAQGPAEVAIRYSKPKDPVQSAREFAFPGVISCLRSSKSVGAQRGDLEALRAREAFHCPGCAPPAADEQPAFCMQDQIGEAFSDWMAAEVLPEYLQTYHPKLTADQRTRGYANVFRLNGCEPDLGSAIVFGAAFDTHPPNRKRVDRVLIANPNVRQQLGCSDTLPAEPRYCVVGVEVAPDPKPAPMGGGLGMPRMPQSGGIGGPTPPPAGDSSVPGERR